MAILGSSQSKLKHMLNQQIGAMRLYRQCRKSSEIMPFVKLF